MKNYLHFFFLITIIVFKLSSMALHIYVHHDDDKGEKCELCIDALNNQDVDSYIPVQLSVVELPVLNSLEKKNYYKSIYRKLSTDNVRFGRPPPSFI